MQLSCPSRILLKVWSAIIALLVLVLLPDRPVYHHRLLLTLPVFLYSSYQVIAAKKTSDQEAETNLAEETQSETANENQQTTNGLPITTITVKP